ncbi:MAG TPA: hypothetical protein VJM51_05095, partial [Dehalococcoidia bacterium]|nr:hypothetical protein [Dehalococcoidia bacterium]
GRVTLLDSISRGRYTLAVDSWEQVQGFYRTVGEYLYFEQDGGGWVISGGAVPPGFITGLAAAQLRPLHRSGLDPEVAPAAEIARRWKDFDR